MVHHILTAAVLAAAIALYAAGSVTGSSICAVTGAALELWFWVRLMRPRHARIGVAGTRRR